MIDIIKFVLGGFWRFWGFVIIMALIGNFLYEAYVAFLNFIVKMKHGHRPSKGEWIKEDV